MPVQLSGWQVNELTENKGLRDNLPPHLVVVFLAMDMRQS